MLNNAGRSTKPGAAWCWPSWGRQVATNTGSSRRTAAPSTHDPAAAQAREGKRVPEPSELLI